MFLLSELHELESELVVKLLILKLHKILTFTVSWIYGPVHVPVLSYSVDMICLQLSVWRTIVLFLFGALNEIAQTPYSWLINCSIHSNIIFYKSIWPSYLLRHFNFVYSHTDFFKTPFYFIIQIMFSNICNIEFNIETY